MIKIKRVYDPPSEDDGKRVLVDRLWPRGVKREDAKIDEWVREIAPSNQLRKWFAHDPSRWQLFKMRYKQELKEKSEIIERFCKEAKRGIITLLFAAKDIEHNNAIVLKEVIEERIKS